MYSNIIHKKIHILYGLFVSVFCFLVFVHYSFSGAVSALEDRLKTADGYIKTRNYLKAKEIYRDIFLSAPKGALSEKALFGMGKSDYYLRNYYEARQNLKRFVSLSQIPEYRDEAYLLLGYISLNLQRIKEAEQYFEMVGATMKERADIGKAEVALKTGNIAKAESFLAGISKRVLETDPRVLYLRAMIYSSKGMHKEAVSTINKIMDTILKEQDIRVEKAQILFNARKLKEAEKLCIFIMADKPVSNIERLKAKKILMDIYETEGKLDDALKLGIELSFYEPGDEFKLRIVSLYDRKGDINNAMKYISYLKNAKLRSAEIERRLKDIINLKDPNTIEYVKKFSPYLDPDSPFILNASRYLIANGKKFEGILLLRKALKGRLKGDASLYMADLLITEGKYSEAEKILAPLTLDSRYLYRASYMIADIMERQGKYALAIEYLMRIVKTATDYRIAAKLGDLYLRTGDRQNSMKYYIIAADRGDGLSSVKAGDCLYISGNYAKAKVYYKKALDFKVKDQKSLQWAQYQYGKLANNRDYLKKAATGGGEVAEAAAIILGEK